MHLRVPGSEGSQARIWGFKRCLFNLDNFCFELSSAPHLRGGLFFGVCVTLSVSVLIHMWKFIIFASVTTGYSSVSEYSGDTSHINGTDLW